MIKAGVSSEWDSCDFVLVQMTPGYIKTLKERSLAAKLIPYNADMFSLIYWDSPDGWYLHSLDDWAESIAEDSVHRTDILQELSWSFVEFEEDGERDSFSQPEQRIDCCKMEVFKDGTARFTAVGKNTGEDFWTFEFSIEAIDQNDTL